VVCCGVNGMLSSRFIGLRIIVVFLWVGGEVGFGVFC